MSAVMNNAPTSSPSTAPIQRTYEPVPGLQESIVSTLMRASLRFLFKPVIKPPMPVGLQRAVLHTLSVSMPPGGASRSST